MNPPRSDGRPRPSTPMRRREQYEREQARYRQRASRRRRPIKTEYIKVPRRRYRLSPHIFLTVFLIFAGGLGTAFSYAFLNDMRLQIERQRSAVQQQREENMAVQAEILRHRPLEEVSQIARERLGMAPPDPSQIFHIEVPVQGYVELSEEPAPQRPTGMWQGAWHQLRAWFSF